MCACGINYFNIGGFEHNFTHAEPLINNLKNYEKKFIEGGCCGNNRRERGKQLCQLMDDLLIDGRLGIDSNGDKIFHEDLLEGEIPKIIIQPEASDY